LSAGPAAAGLELPLEAEDFLLHLVVEKGRSALTVEAYRRDLLRYLRFLRAEGSDLSSADAELVARFASGLRAAGLAPASVTRTLVAVRNLHRWLAAEGVRRDDPTATVETPRLPKPLPKALSEAQVMSLLDLVDAAVARSGAGREHALALRDRALLEVLYGTGARVSEVCGVGFGGLDLDAALLRLLGKRSKERIVPLGRPAVRALVQWLETGRPVLAASGRGTRDDAEAVFLGTRGTRITRQGVWLVIRRWAREAGLEEHVSPHVFRHSCATHLLDHGADIRTVQELLGHASISTTQIYTRVATDRLWQAYNAAHPRATIG
jgi:integrase/recombinase XerD